MTNQNEREAGSASNAGLGRWTPISEEFPCEGVPVFLWDGKRVWVGAHEFDGDGWAFGNTYGHFYFNSKSGDWETSDNECDDDYKPTHWMYLPEPPAA